MQTEKGRENFQNQILQIVGSIQNTNDLDVHMALILAPSYANQVRNQYYMENTLSQSLRDYVDTFGFCQKNMNAMDIIIEDTKQLLASWGGEEPDFMLVAPKLCFQLTMTQVWWWSVFFSLGLSPTLTPARARRRSARATLRRATTASSCSARARS